MPRHLLLQSPRRHHLRAPVPAALAGALAIALAATLSLAGAAVFRAPAAHAATTDWTTLWRDDFLGTGALPSSDWLYRIGTQVPGGPPNFGTGEVETNTNSIQNVFQRKGLLHIKAIRDASGGWTSGRIETARDDFQPPAGGELAVEAKMQLPNVTGAAAAGYWPAFWMLGTPYRSNPWSWPGIGELDIMENVQGLNTEYGTMHCGTSPGGPCNEKDGLSGNTPGGTPSLQTGMHTYRVEWDESVTPNAIRWYLDGRLFHQVTQDQVPADTWAAAFDHGYYLILNLAIGGEFPAKMGGGPTAQTASGGELLIDYVSVKARGGSGSTPTPTPTATATPTPAPTATATPTPTPTTTAGTRDARSRIEAESFDASSGVSVVANSGGGYRVDQVVNGDWLLYRNVSFGATGPRTLSVRVASGAAGGVSGLLEARLDVRTNPVIGSCAIANTGGWEAWQTVPCNVEYPTGTHDLYLTFSSGQPAPFLSLDWLTFS